VLFYVLDAVLGLSTAFARDGERNNVLALQLRGIIYPVSPLALRTGDFVSGATAPVHLLTNFVDLATEIAHHNICSIVPYVWHHSHASALPLTQSHTYWNIIRVRCLFGIAQSPKAVRSTFVLSRYLFLLVQVP
jgi:hypothetical protein